MQVPTPGPSAPVQRVPSALAINTTVNSRRVTADFTGCIVYLHIDSYMTAKQADDVRQYITGCGGVCVPTPDDEGCTHVVTGRRNLREGSNPGFRVNAQPGAWAQLMERLPDAAPAVSGPAAPGGHARAVPAEWIWRVRGQVLGQEIHFGISRFDNRERSPELMPWDPYLRTVNPHYLASVLSTVKPEHRECFEAHRINFERWKTDTCPRTGWPMLRYNGGRRTYMADVNALYPEKDWLSGELMWTKYSAQFRRVVPKLGLLARQTRIKAKESSRGTDQYLE